MIKKNTIGNSDKDNTKKKEKVLAQDFFSKTEKRKRYWCGICMTTVAVCIASYVCGAVPIRPLLLSRPTNTPFLPVRNWYSN